MFTHVLWGAAHVETHQSVPPVLGDVGAEGEGSDGFHHLAGIVETREGQGVPSPDEGENVGFEEMDGIRGWQIKEGAGGGGDLVEGGRVAQQHEGDLLVI